MIAITLRLTGVSGDEIGRLQVPNAGVTITDSLDTTTAKATVRRTRQMIEHVRATLQSEQFDTTLAPREFEQRVAEGLLVAGLQGPVDGEVLISLPVLSTLSTLSIPSTLYSTSSTPEATQPEPLGGEPAAGEPAADRAWDDLFQISETHPEAAADAASSPPMDKPQGTPQGTPQDTSTLDPSALDTFTELSEQTEGESA